jgi:UDP-N-acetylglucosamine 2-epimerase
MKVCFIYSNRAEFSELKPFIEYFQSNSVTKVINLSQKIRKLDNDLNLYKIYKKCYDVFLKEKFDYVCILGDRRELPFIALAGFYLDVKIVHIAAGDFSESNTIYDQYVRPMISIPSNIQICFSKESKKNVDKLFNAIPYLKSNSYFFGNPVFKNVDTSKMKRKIKEKYDLVLLHPQSLSKAETENDIKYLKKCLQKRKTIFILGNNDKNSDLILDFYNKLKNDNYIFVKSVEKIKYFGLVKYCNNFYTNSSSIDEIKFLNENCLKIIGKRNKNRNKDSFNENAPEQLLKLLKKSMMKKID